MAILLPLHGCPITTSKLLTLAHLSRPPSNGHLCGIISLLSNIIMPTSRLSHWLSTPVCEAEDPHSILFIVTFSKPLSTLQKRSLDRPKRKADPITPMYWFARGKSSGWACGWGEKGKGILKPLQEPKKQAFKQMTK